MIGKRERIRIKSGGREVGRKKGREGKKEVILYF